MIQVHLMDESKISLVTMATLDTGNALPSHLSYSEAHRLFTAVLNHKILVFAIDEAALFQFRQLALFSAGSGVKFAKMFNQRGERFIVAGLENGEVRTFRFIPGAEPTLAHVLAHTTGGNDGEIRDADWRSDGTLLVTTAKNGTTKLWDISGSEAYCKSSLNNPESAAIFARSCRFLSDATVLVTYYAPRGPSIVAKFNLETGKDPQVAKISGKHAISALALSPDKKSMLLGYASGNHEVWSTENFKLIKKGAAEEHDMPITAVALFENHSRLTGSADFTLRMTGPPNMGSQSWCSFLGKVVLVAAIGIVAGSQVFSI